MGTAIVGCERYSTWSMLTRSIVTGNVHSASELYLKKLKLSTFDEILYGNAVLNYS